MSERARAGAAAAVVAVVAFLPFARGTLAGASLYFRDLSLYFFPLRRLALDALLRGEIALWNPYLHEGVPLSLPALGYPLDLLGALAPREAFLSLLLALHVPLAAVFLLRLARGIGLGLEAAALGALVFALGGFMLSTVNLYVLAQAAAWAPLVVLWLVRLLRDGGGRALAGAAATLAVALATTGVEIAAQAVAVGVALGLRAGRPWRSLGRLAAALALSAALAAPVLVLLRGQLAGSARAQGFATDVVLAHSVHPMTLAQTLVGDLYGDLHDVANLWWGDNFFPRGFPYVLSLYLGAVVACLAAVALASGHAAARRLALVAALGLLASLGRYAGLAPVVDALPALHAVRFPVKAFFSVHLAVALLAAIGLSTLAGGRRWRTFAALASGLGALLAAAPWLPRIASAPTLAFAAAFFPPRVAPEARAALLERVLTDAQAGGLVALSAAAVAWLALRGTLGARRGAWLVAALAATDLLRSGAGLNPTVSSDFYRPSPELQARLPELAGGRVFTCPVDTSAAYEAVRAARAADHEALSFAALQETLTPACNVPRQVATALSPDLTMLVPTERVLPADGSCRDIGGLLPRLREAGVTHVVSLDPLVHPDLAPAFTTRPARIAPLAVHAYELARAHPRLELETGGVVGDVSGGAGWLQLTVESSLPGRLVVRDAWAEGWAARVDGQPRPVVRAGRHQAVELPGGRRLVRLEYRPPGFTAAWGVALLALAVVLALAWPRRGAGPRVASDAER